MSISKPVMTVKDTVTFNVNETDLIYKVVGEVLKTPKRNVPCSDGLQWWVEWYPAGSTAKHQKHISVFMYVNKAVSAKYKFKVDGSSIQFLDVREFTESCLAMGGAQFASHEQLRPLFINNKLSITSEVEFNVSVPFDFLTPRVGQFCDHVLTDFELVIGSDRLQVHKNLLSLISPVFHAMLTHDTAESKSGSVKVTDFDFATVKTVIDFCYGKDLPTPSVEVVILMLRFADKYGMKAVTNQLEKIPQKSLTITTYPAIVLYAYDCAKGPLLVECTKFFKEHVNEIKVTPNFIKLPLTVVVHILKSAFDLKTYADVFQHARNNGFAFVNERLQNLSSVSFDTFFVAVSYAWANSCDNLKKACATFYNDHRDAVMSINAFLDLTPEQGWIRADFLPARPGPFFSNLPGPAHYTAQTARAARGPLKLGPARASAGGPRFNPIFLSKKVAKRHSRCPCGSPKLILTFFNVFKFKKTKKPMKSFVKMYEWFEMQSQKTDYVSTISARPARALIFSARHGPIRAGLGRPGLARPVVHPCSRSRLRGY